MNENWICWSSYKTDSKGNLVSSKGNLVSTLENITVLVPKRSQKPFRPTAFIRVKRRGKLEPDPSKSEDETFDNNNKNKLGLSCAKLRSSYASQPAYLS